MADDEAAVRRASIDPERLLPGEDPQHPRAGDPAHWVAVYNELLTTKRALIATLLQAMAALSPDAQAELQRADVHMLELQVQRFETRLAVWSQKLQGAG